MQWAAMLATSMAKWGDTPAYPSAQGTSLKRYEEELDRSKFHLLNCCCCCSLITKSCLILCNPTDGNPPLSMGFSRREYWSGLPFPSPGDLSDPGLLHCRQMLYHLSQQWDLVTLKKLKTVSVIDQRLLLVKLQTILRSLALSENLIGFFFSVFHMVFQLKVKCRYIYQT